MSNWTIASRGRVRGAAIALSAVGALAFAPAALAQPPVTVTNTTGLISAINAANSAGGTNEIILAPDGTNGPYEPTTPITVAPGDNLEISGEPKNQATTTLNTETDINGSAETNLQQDLITVDSGANLLLKGFSISSSVSDGFYTVEVNGNAEIDNMAFFGENGTIVGVDQSSLTQVPNVTIDNSFLGNSAIDSVENNTGNASFNDDTITGNFTGGIVFGSGNTVLNNTLIANNGSAPDCQNGTPTSETNSIDNDGSCGVTTKTLTQIALPTGGALSYKGGPTPVLVLKSTSVVYGAGNTAYCLSDDQRFFAKGSTCDVGSYQQNNTAQYTDTAPPICTVYQTNESNNPAVASTQTVNVTDPSGPGLGPDVNIEATFLKGSGTISMPTTPVGYPETNPNAVDPSLLDAPTDGPYPVTASKPVGDLTVGDTSWEFLVQDWLGNSTTCK